MEILHLSRVSVRDAAKKAAHALASGQLIIYPTDMLYGIGADASSSVAIRRLRLVKGRESKKPISVIVPNVRDIHLYAEVNEMAQSFIDRFLPGPLTIVLPAKKTISPEITLNGAIGIRVSNDSFTRELGIEFGKPFTATSANRAGREAPKTIHSIIEQFGHDSHEFTMAIDDGERTAGLPSSVISCVNEMPHLIREGALTRKELGL